MRTVCKRLANKAQAETGVAAGFWNSGCVSGLFSAAAFPALIKS